MRNPVTVEALKMDLMRQTWESVYVSDVNEAYNSFLGIFKECYDKNCPLRTHSAKSKNENKPWITNKLKNAIKKKNTLYREFLRSRTEKAERRYRLYKNKLTNIIRLSKEKYYSKLVEGSRNNIRETWKLINTLIRKNSGKTISPQSILKEDNHIYKKEDIANEFNNFFVNVGPDLARDIVQPINTDEVSNLIEINVKSMFLTAVHESEVMKIVRAFKSKWSTDNNGLDMALIRDTIECVVKPLTYICNLSLTTGIFPNEMKTAKVIPLFKSGGKDLLSNYRPVSLLPQFSKNS